MNYLANGKKTMIKLLFVLAVTVAASFIVSQNANAVSETGRTNYKLANGVVESTLYVTDSAKNNVRTHVVRVNKNANVSLKVSTKQYYKKGSTKASRTEFAKNWTYDKWGYATVEQHAANYESSADKAGNVIAACNGDYSYMGEYNGMTYGNLIMEGNVIRQSTDYPYFAVMKDGSYDIRDGKESIGNVEEAVGGFRWLLKDGNIVTDKKFNNYFKTIQAVGLTSDNELIMLNADGRDPVSEGTSMKDVSTMFKQLGCVEALLFDSGGSASMVTKRASDKKVMMRNTPNDGFTREIASSLMIVSNTKPNGLQTSDSGVKSIVNPKTKLIKTKSGVYQYMINGVYQKGFFHVNDNMFLFNGKGKGINKTIKLGKTKYYYKKGMMKGTSDKKKSGRVAIGFCGAGNGGKNLMYAYQYGNKKLNIGRNPMIKKNNGKMKEWGNVIYVPWQAEKHRIKSVYIGDGVKSVGSRFLYISKNPLNPIAKRTKPVLKTVSLPSSITSIGNYSFFNQVNLKKITLPKKVTKIGNSAFSFGNGRTYTFKSAKPPKFGTKVFEQDSKTKKSTFKVPKTKTWKSFFKKSSNKKRIKLNGKVKFK